MTLEVAVAVLGIIGGVGAIASVLMRAGALRRDIEDIGKRHDALAREVRVENGAKLTDIDKRVAIIEDWRDGL